MSKRLIAALCLLIPAIAPPAVGADVQRKPLQPLIDAAEPDSTLKLAPGTYAGPVVIEKPLTLDGQGEAVVDAGGEGSVITLKTDGAKIRNIHLTNSGDSHNDIDAGVQVRGMFNIIEDTVIDNCLFGIDLQQSEYNMVRRNRISSKPADLGIRGDSVRLWYSFNNKITDNVITDSRDMVVWYSKDNLIAGNTSSGGRYSLHFMYSQHNVVEDNYYFNNSVGIFLMYSDSVEVRNNRITNAIGATGMGIGFKETSDVVIENNEILYCGTGIYLDVSPYQPGTTNRFIDNTIAFSSIGILFHNDWTGNVFTGNNFKDNITSVAVDGATTAKRNEWTGNYWDDYEGFDRDADGIGDTPYEHYTYADRLWMDVPPVRFFKGAPILEALDFLERLAPFTSPSLVLRDKPPLMDTQRPHHER